MNLRNRLQPEDLFETMFLREPSSKVKPIFVHDLGTMLLEYANGSASRSALLKRVEAEGRTRAQINRLFDSVDAAVSGEARAFEVEKLAHSEERAGRDKSRSRFDKRLGI